MIFPGVPHYLSTVIYVVYVEDDVDRLLLFSLITFFFILSLHSCFTDTDVKHENEMDLYETIDEKVSERKIFKMSLELSCVGGIPQNWHIGQLYYCLTFLPSLLQIYFTLSLYRNPNINAQIAQCCAFYEKHREGRCGQD